MRMGHCGYGLACKFHHPEPVFYDPYQEYGIYADSEAVFWEPNQEYGSYVGEDAVEYQYGYLGINDGWNGELFDVREPCAILNNVGLPLRPVSIKILFSFLNPLRSYFPNHYKV